MYIYVYLCVCFMCGVVHVCMYVIMIKKRYHTFEIEQGEVYEKVLREGKKERMQI